MSRKKKSKDMKNKLYLSIGAIAILLVVLLVLLGYRLFNQKDYYEVDSRINEVKEKGKIDDTYSTAGWLKVQGTDIDIPVVYSENFEKEFPMELESFAWTRSGDAKFHNIIKVTGHNLFNLSSKPKIKSKNFHRLDQLMAFVYYDFAKENKYIQYTVDGKDYVYKIFAAGFIDQGYYFSIQTDYPKDVMKSTIDEAKKMSLYDYKVDVKENDNLISLSTCTRFFGQEDEKNFFVFGRMVREGEKINNYRVVKNDSYKKVEKILKGDDNDENDTL